MGFLMPFTRRKYHLVVHQAIHIPNPENHLLCPMQCRTNGVNVNECPGMYCPDPTEESHSIVAHDDDHEHVIILFFLRGVTSLFHTFVVEVDEFERHDCPPVELTPSQLTWAAWYPSSTVFEAQENRTINHKW